MEATAAVGGAGRLVIGKGAYDGRKNDYEKCLRFLGMSDPYIYNGNKDSYGKRFVTYEAADGKPGLGGRSGRSCGEIVVGRVTIDAIPGAAATGGSQGSFGPTAKVKDESFSYAHYNSVAFGNAAVVIGIVGCFIPPVGYVGAFLSVIQTFLDMGGISDWKDLRKIGWLTGGGGGGGGGAGALEWFDSPAKFLSYDLYGAGGAAGAAVSLPQGYVAVEYIESTRGGNQYVDTEVAASKTLRATMDYVPFEHTGDVNLGANESWRYFNYREGPLFDWGTARTGVHTATGALSLNARYLVNVGADGEATYLAVANVETKTALKSYTAVCEGELKVEHVTVFGGSLAVGFRYAPMRLYSLTIYEGAKLKRDFVPCVSATEGAGLWDCVGRKFYPNKGGTAFNTP